MRATKERTRVSRILVSNPRMQPFHISTKRCDGINLMSAYTWTRERRPTDHPRDIEKRILDIIIELKRMTV